MAARLENLATPNTVVMSAATYQLVRGISPSQTWGCMHSKASLRRSRRIRYCKKAACSIGLVATMHGLTPFVGRDAEVTLLDERWRQ